MRIKRFTFLHLIIVAALLGLTGCSRTAEDVAKWKSSGNIEKLIKALSDPKYEIRLEATQALGELQAEDALDDLAALYNDPETDIVMAAVDALANIGTPSTITPLAAALKLDPVESRLSAAVKLGEMKAIGAVPQLVEALNDSEEEIQLAAADSIGQIGDASGSKGLAGKLDASSSNLRKICAESLGHTGGEVAIEALIPAMADPDSGVSEAARGALISIGDPSVPFVLEALKAEETDVRAGAIFVLRELKAVPDTGTYQVWYQLAGVSVDSENGIDDRVVESLLKMGPDAVEPLLEAAAHPVEDFREHATVVLEGMGEKVLEKVNTASETYANDAAKKWRAARDAWAGAPSWRIDLWSGLASLDPTFSPNTATVHSLDLQARPAYNILTTSEFAVIREYVPLLINLLGDTTEPPPTQPDYDAAGMPIVKKRQDMFHGETNRKLAAEKLAQASSLSALPLIAAIEGKNEHIAGHAAMILGKQSDKRALEPLMKVVQKKLDAREPLSDSPFYLALLKMDAPQAEPLLLKIRPNPDRALQVFDRKYSDIRPISAETTENTGDLTQPITFRIGYIDRGRIAEFIITFALDDAGHWVPTPALPDQLAAM